ncbi:hypothetical protein H4R20_005125, partial [Coemansia guatemalensis]
DTSLRCILRPRYRRFSIKCSMRLLILLLPPPLVVRMVRRGPPVANILPVYRLLLWNIGWVCLTTDLSRIPIILLRIRVRHPTMTGDMRIEWMSLARILVAAMVLLRDIREAVAILRIGLLLPLLFAIDMEAALLVPAVHTIGLRVAVVATVLGLLTVVVVVVAEVAAMLIARLFLTAVVVALTSITTTRTKILRTNMITTARNLPLTMKNNRAGELKILSGPIVASCLLATLARDRHLLNGVPIMAGLDRPAQQTATPRWMRLRIFLTEMVPTLSMKIRFLLLL